MTGNSKSTMKNNCHQTISPELAVLCTFETSAQKRDRRDRRITRDIPDKTDDNNS